MSSTSIPISVWVEIRDTTINEPEIIKVHDGASVGTLKEQLLGKDSSEYEVFYRNQLLNADITIPQDTNLKEPLLLKKVTVDIPAKPILDFERRITQELGASRHTSPSSTLTSASQPLFTGGCQCGSIRYAIYSRHPSFPISVCHCRMCQKALATPYGVFITVSTEDFQWTRGSPAFFQSSSIALRLFCSQCGTPLALQPKQQLLLDILIGSLDRPQEVGAPEEQVGIESCLGEWAKVRGLEDKTSDETNGNATSTIINYQHPDHETVEWPIRKSFLK